MSEPLVIAIEHYVALRKAIEKRKKWVVRYHVGVTMNLSDDRGLIANIEGGVVTSTTEHLPIIDRIREIYEKEVLK